MKNTLCKVSSFIVNLFIGAVSVIALAVIYAFIFEENNKDHDVGLGVLVLFIWLSALIIPNLFFKTRGKFSIKEVVIFQVMPFVLGTSLYIFYQLVFR